MVEDGNTAFHVVDGDLYKSDTNEVIWVSPIDKHKEDETLLELKKENLLLKKRIRMLEKYIRELKRK